MHQVRTRMLGVFWQLGFACLTIYAAGYCILSGWRLRRTRDFTGWKFKDRIKPDEIAAAANYFGWAETMLAPVFLSANLFYFLPRHFWVWLHIPIPVLGVAFAYGIARYCSNRPRRKTG